jgi:hypothetical protein
MAQTAEFITQFGGQVIAGFYAHAAIRVSVPLRSPRRRHRRSRGPIEASRALFAGRHLPCRQTLLAEDSINLAE